jgi:alpha-glucoside transport system permease protein
MTTHVQRIAAPRHRTAEPARPLLRRVPVHVVVLGLTAVWLVPVVGLVVSSFRPPSAVVRSGWWESFALPGDYTLDNYRDVLGRDGMALSLANSLAVVVPATVLVVAVSAAAAYALACLRFRFRRGILLTVVGLLVVPMQITLVPLLQAFNALDLTGSFLGIWLVHLGYGVPFGVYLLHSAFAALPRALFEAAEVDGASRSQVFLRIVLPVTRPALASLAVFEFVWTWNDLLTALIFLGGRREVAPVTVAVSWEVLTAAAVVSAVVPMVVFAALQKHFVRGLLAGTTKG